MSKQQSKTKYKQEAQEPVSNKVKMRFSEHKYYTDLEKPLFLAGEVYELEGADWIQRWLKRGGEIVSGGFELPKTEAVPKSSLVDTPKEADNVSIETGIGLEEDSKDSDYL